jgi:peroxiredoxin
VVRRAAVAVMMLAVVGLLIWAGYFNLRARRDAMLKRQQNEVILTKTDSPSAGGASDSSNGMGTTFTGRPAPGFTLVDLSGKKVRLSDFKGHAVVLNFWATWCGPCKLEMPWFEEMYGKYKPQGLVILGLSQDDGMDAADIAKAAKKIGVTYPILQPDEKVSKAYELADYLPETYYLDKNGVVVEQTVGAHSKDELEADIQKAIK